MTAVLESRARLLAAVLAVCLLALGAVRFAGAGFLPATRTLTGDFGASFPTQYFARLRPDIPTEQVWSGWNYGPALHFLTLPLLLVPDWSMVPPIWALTNLAALTLSFILILRLAGTPRELSWRVIGMLAGLWMLFQPLATCFAQGNIEILEMLLILTAVSWLPRWEGSMSGVLIGIAAMAKFLPIGFLAWLLVRRHYRAALAGLVTIAALAALATVTLGWRDSTSLRAMTWAAGSPVAGLHELSVTSMFLHRAGLLDYDATVVRWFPVARGEAAAQAGNLTSALLAIGFGLVLFFRRRQPISAFEISVLFMTMFMILPWNHDYYYIFALVPFSILFLRTIAARKWAWLALTIVAYLLMSPPVPYSLIDRMNLFAIPFAYVVNYGDVPVVGALLLWFAATHQMLAESSSAALHSSTA